MEEEKQELSAVPRFANAWLTYLKPFVLVTRGETDEWSSTLEQCNNGTYDYVKLHRISWSVDIGLPGHFHMYVGFDGYLIIPITPECSTANEALNIFNRVLGDLLLGGIYAEAAGLDDIDQAIVGSTSYVRALGAAKSFDARLHAILRTQAAGPFDAIVLFEPKRLDGVQFEQALSRGREMSQQLPELSTFLMMEGYSWFARKSWTNALSFFWICVEQLTSHLWRTKILVGAIGSKVPGRGDFLKDNRTWTTSNRLELLFQKSIIDEITYESLTVARKARNALAHDGRPPTNAQADAALVGVFNMLSIALLVEVRTIANDLISKARDLSKPPVPINTPTPVKNIKALWMRIPPIPGEKEWQGDYERILKGEQESSAAEPTPAEPDSGQSGREG